MLFGVTKFKLKILTSVWSARHPRAGQNIQHLALYLVVFIGQFLGVSHKNYAVFTGFVSKKCEILENGYLRLYKVGSLSNPGVVKGFFSHIEEAETIDKVLVNLDTIDLS